MSNKRTCSSCTLCCKLLPVRELEKGANQRCQFQSTKGCRVYHDASRMPPSCRLWSCQWVANKELPRELRRPDRVHYVIDMMPDFTTHVDNETGESTDIPVVQIWCDPGHPDAHRDPALRAWLDAVHRCALVRFDSRRAIFLAPPSVNADGTWYEHVGNCETQHTPREIFERAGMRVNVEIK